MTRTLLQQTTDHYIDLYNGNDTDDGSQSAPWRTCQHAWDWSQQNYDLCGQQLYFNILPTGVGSGVLPPLIASEKMVGQVAYPIFRGDLSNPWNVVVHTTGHTFNAFRDATFGAQGVSIQSDTNCGLFSQWNSKIYAGNNNYLACGFAHMMGTKDGWVFQDGPYSIWGSAPYHAVGDLGTVFISGGNGAVCNIHGQPVFSSFAYAIEPTGKVLSHTMTFSGPVIGQRYRGIWGGSIGCESNPNYFPGTIAGQVAPPGVFEGA